MVVLVKESTALSPPARGRRPLHREQPERFSKKTFKSTHGALDVKIPRDRDGSFTPTLIPPHRRVLGSLEDAVLTLYAVGVSTRDISEQLEHLHGPAISPALVSRITDTALPMMIECQNRPLDSLYVIVFLDAIHTGSKPGGKNRCRIGPRS